MKQMKLINAALIAAAFFVSAVSQAQMQNVSTAAYSEKMPSSFRIGFLGAYGVVKPSGFETTGNGDTTNASGSILASFGSGALSFEAGVSYSLIPIMIESKDASGGKHKLLISSTYVGIPLALKYNYIEKPLASFFVKAGAAPMMLMSQTPSIATGDDGSTTSLELTETDFVALLGIGGTAPLTDSLAFLLDITGYYGMTEAYKDAKHQGLNIGIGLSYDL